MMTTWLRIIKNNLKMKFWVTIQDNQSQQTEQLEDIVWDLQELMLIRSNKSYKRKS